MRKSLWISYGLAAAALVVSVTTWTQVPNPMPLHWNALGEADGFGPRALGLLMMPALVATLAPFIAWICNRRVDTAQGKRAVDIIIVSMSAFMLGMHVLMVEAALSPTAQLSIAWVMSLMGTMFAALGAAMPMLPQNKVAGIRTPWTLANDVNWKLTHRFGAWTMAIGGVTCILASLVLTGQTMFWVAFGAVMTGSLLPVVYSYLLHRAQNERL